jgi:hypothetical protein
MSDQQADLPADLPNQPEGGMMKTRLATILTILGLVGGTGAAVALAGGTSSTGNASAAASQYCNGKSSHCKYPPPPKK